MVDPAASSSNTGLSFSVDGDNLTFTGTGTAEHLFLKVVSGKLQYSTSGSTYVEVAEFAFSTAAKIVVSLEAGDDALILDNSVIDALTSVGGTLSFSGGDGQDTLTGLSNDTTWNITDSNAGGLAKTGSLGADKILFSNTENLQGGSGDDEFVFKDATNPDGSKQAIYFDGTIDGGDGIDKVDYSSTTSALELDLSPFNNIESIIGGQSTNDFLYGTSIQDNTWEITGINAGTINQVDFSGFENLVGGQREDTFKFFSNGQIAGTVDGGGQNYSDYTSDSKPDAVQTGERVQLADGSIYEYKATTVLQPATGQTTIDLTDTAQQYTTNTDWELVTIKGDQLDFSNLTTAIKADLITNQVSTATKTLVTFSGIEAIKGSTSTNDVLRAVDQDNIWNITGDNEGDLNGEISFSQIETLQGANNFNDWFVFDKDNGTFDGTIDGGTGGLDNFAIATKINDETTYSEFKDLNSGDVDKSGTTDVNTGGSTKTINYKNLDYRPVFKETDTEIIYYGSVGNDIATLEDKTVGVNDGQLLLKFTNLSFFSSNGTLTGAEYTISNSSKTIVIQLGYGNDKLTIKTLDPFFNSSLTIRGGDTASDNLVLGFGAGSNTFDNDTVTIENSLTLQGRDLTIEAENITVTNNVTISTRTVGSATDLETAASTGDSGSISFTGQFIKLNEGVRLLSQVQEGSNFSAGDITLDASKSGIAELEIAFVNEKKATVEIGKDAKLLGGAVGIFASAFDTDFTTLLGTSDLVNHFVIGPLLDKLGSLTDLGLPVKVLTKSAIADINIQENVQITGSGAVTISSYSDITSATSVSSKLISVGYAEAKSHATLSIAKGTNITAEDQVLIKSWGIGNSSMEATNSKELGDWNPAKISLAIAVARTDIKSTVVLAEGTTITAGKTANIVALGEHDTTAKAESGLYSTGIAGLAFSIGLSDADVKAEVNGSVTANMKSGSVVKIEFDPQVTYTNGTATSPVIDFVNNRINLAKALNNADAISDDTTTPHALQTGDQISYANRRGNSIGGLQDGGDYYVVVDPNDPDWIYLSKTYAKAIAAAEKLDEGEPLTSDIVSGDVINLTEFDGINVKTALNTKTFNPTDAGVIQDNAITLPNAGSVGNLDPSSDSIYGSTFELGQAVVYRKGDASNQAIGGLEDGKVYYIITDTNEKNLKGDYRFVDKQTFRLAETENKARAGIALNIDPTTATGTGHSFSSLHVIDSGLATGVGILADLKSSNTVESSSGLESQDFDPNPKTGFDKVKQQVNTSLGDRLFGAFSEKATGNDSYTTVQEQVGSSSKLSIAGALSYLDTDHKVLAIVGDINDGNNGDNFDSAFGNIEDQTTISKAKIRSKEDLEVKATITEKMQLNAESTNEPQDADSIQAPTGEPDPDVGNADFAASAAVIIGLQSNQAKAIVQQGAQLDAYRATRIISDVTYPFLTRIDEFVPGTAGEFLDQWKSDKQDVVLKYLDGSVGLKPLLNTWARSTAKAADGGLSASGSVNVLDFNNISKAVVKSGALINQDVAWRAGSLNQSVSVEATNYMQMLSITGVFDFKLPALDIDLLSLKPTSKDEIKDDLKPEVGVSGSADQRGGIGGALFLNFLKNTTQAVVEGGAKIYSGALGGLNLKAEEATLNFSFGQSGAVGGTFGIAGTVNYFQQRSNTLAQIAGGVTITGGTLQNEPDLMGSPLTVYAGSLGTNINWTGGVAKASNLGFGVSIAINDINRNTNAVIGNLDPAVDATAGKAPSTNTSITNMGDINVQAKVAGAIWAFSVAAAIASESTPDNSKPGTKASKSPIGGVNDVNFGLGVSGDVSINLVTDTARAYIHDAGTIKGETVNVQALNTANVVVASGAAAFVSGSDNTASIGIAGSVSVNDLKGTTQAYVKGENATQNKKLVLEGKQATIAAERRGDIFALTVGGSLVTGASNDLQLAIAGSVSVNLLNDNTVEAFLQGTSLTVTNQGDLTVRAQDRSAILAIAGAISISAATGESSSASIALGASLAFNEIKNGRIRAFIDKSSVTAGGVAVTSTFSADIRAITVAGSGSGVAGGGLALAGAGAGSGNQIVNLIEASIKDSNSVTSTRSDGSVLISAMDQSMISAVGGGFAVALSLNIGASSSPAVGVSLGLSAAYNKIDNDTLADINNSTVTSVGAVNVSARSAATINALTLAAAVAASASVPQAGGAGAGAGAGSGNFVTNQVEALIRNGSKVTTTGANGHVNLLATDEWLLGFTKAPDAPSTLVSDLNNQVGTSAELTKFFNKNGVQFSGVVAVSALEQSKEWLIKDTLGRTYRIVKDGNDFKVFLTSAIVANAVGVAASASGSFTSGGAFAIGAVITKNEVKNTIRASVEGTSTLVKATGAVGLNATSNGLIEGLLVGATLSLNASGGAGAGIAASLTGAFNTIGNTVEASLKNAAVVEMSNGGDVSLTAKDTSLISTKGIGVSASVSISGSVSVGIGVAAAIAINDIANTVKATVDKGTIRSAGAVSLEALSESTITALTVGVGVSVSGGKFSLSGAGGAGVSTNKITNTVDATIANESEVGGTSIQLSATDNSTIDASSAGVAAALAIGGAAAVSVAVGVAIADNTITNKTRAVIDQSKVTSTGTLALEATSTATIQALTVAASAGVAASAISVALAGAGARANNTIGNTTEAAITNLGAGRSVTATGDIDLNAIDKAQIKADVGSGALSGGLVAGSVSVSVSENAVGNSVQAYISDATVTSTTGSVRAIATSDAQIDATSYATSIAAGIGGAGAGAETRSTIHGKAQTPLATGTTTDATTFRGYIENLNNAGISNEALSSGLKTWLASRGVVLGSTQTVSLIQRDQRWFIETSQGRVYQLQLVPVLTDQTKAGSNPDKYEFTLAELSKTMVAAYIRNATVTATQGAIAVEATSDFLAKANSRGGSAGLVAIGGMVAKADITAATQAYVSNGSKLTAASLNVQATSDRKAEANSLSVSIGGAAGAGAGTTSTIQGDVEAFVGKQAGTSESAVELTMTGAIGIRANATSSATSDADVGAGGAWTGTGLTAKTTVDKTNIRAYVGNDTKIHSVDSLSVAAESTDYANADLLVGAGSAIGVRVMDATVTVKPTVEAYIGNNVTTTQPIAGDISVEAKSVRAEGDAKLQSYGGSLLGNVSSTKADAFITPTITSYIGEGSDLDAAGKISVLANAASEGQAVTPSDTFKPSTAVNTATDTIDFNYNLPEGTVVTYDANGNAPISGLQSLSLKVAVDFADVGSADTITRKDGKKWSDEGYRVGQQITVSGAANQANSGVFTIASISDTKLTLTSVAQLTNETNVTVTVTPQRQYSTLSIPSVTLSGVTFTDVGTADTITRSDKNWADDGFRVGQQIQISGQTQNSGTYTISGISGKVLTLDGNAALRNETASNVIIQPLSLRLGVAFDGAKVDAAKDTITFGSSHNLYDGDRLVYRRNDNQSNIPGLVDGEIYQVKVIDSTTIKLIDPANIPDAPKEFVPVLESGFIKLDGHGFENGDAVTYYSPANRQFNTTQVDINEATVNGQVTVETNANGQIVDQPNNNNILLPSHGFQTGDLIVYNVQGTGDAIGGLTKGRIYKVDKQSDNAIRLRNTTTISGNLVFGDTADDGKDTITRSSGSWLSDGFAAGQTITLSGTTNNNKTFTIDALTAMVITLIATDKVTAETKANVTVDGAIIELAPAKDASGDRAQVNVIHTLRKTNEGAIKAGTGTLIDGVTYYVVNADANKFKLAATSGGPALSLDVSGLSSTAKHRLGVEGLDLGAATGKQHTLHFDLTNTATNTGEHKLLGAGGVSLSLLSPPPGDGKSSVTVISAGGAISGDIAVPIGTLESKPVVKAFVAAKELTAGGDISIQAESIGDVSSLADNRAGGFLQIGTVRSKVVRDATTLAFIGKQAADQSIDGSGVILRAGGNFILSSSSNTTASTSATAEGGGAIGAAIADTSTQVDYTTKAIVGRSANIQATNQLNVYSETKVTAASNAKSFVISLGAGADSDNEDPADYPGGIQIGKSTGAVSEVEIGKNAILTGKTTDLKATVSQIKATARSDAFAASPILFGVAAAYADAEINVNSDAKVTIREGAQITGTEGVDIRATHSGVETRRQVGRLAVALIFPQGAVAEGTDRLNSQITAEAGAKIFAGARKSGTPLVNSTGVNDLALFVEAAVPDWTAVGEGLGIADRYFAPDAFGDRNFTTKNPSRTIDWNADVVIATGASPELVIDAAGNITKAVNVSVNDLSAGGSAQKTSGAVLTNNIVVNDIINRSKGNIVFEALGGSMSGSQGTFDFKRTFETVRITNNSSKDLVINAIDVISDEDAPKVELRTVAVAPTTATAKNVDLQFNIRGIAEPTLVDIQNLSASDIELRKLIENPIGETRILSQNGDIFSAGSEAIIRTNRLGDSTATFPSGVTPYGIKAGGDIGTLNNRINVQLVESDGRPHQILANATGSAYLNLLGLLRKDEPAFTVNVNSITAGTTADVLLQTSQKQVASGTGFGVEVSVPNEKLVDNYYQRFRTPKGSAASVLGISGTGNTKIASTYVFNSIQAGTGNIVIKAAEPTTDPVTNIQGNTNLLGSGRIDVDTDGAITLTETAGDMRVGTITSRKSNVTLTAASGSIVDADNDATSDVNGDVIQLTANLGGIGTANNALDINSATKLTATARDAVVITETTGNLNVDQVTSTSSSVTLTAAAGDLVDFNNTAASDVDAATSIILAASGAIGSATNDLDINSAKGGTGSLTATAGTGIYITETEAALNVAKAQTTVGNIRLTVPDLATEGQDLNLLSGGVISTGNGAIDLLVGDNVTTDGTSSITALGTTGIVTIRGDYNSQDAAGTTMLLGGTFTGSKIDIYGNADADFITFNQTQLNGPTLVRTGAGADNFFVDRLKSMAISHALTLDGEGDGDIYRVDISGGNTDNLINIFDSGTSGTDTLAFNGTAGADNLLMRASSEAFATTANGLWDASSRIFGGGLAFVAALKNNPVQVERVNYTKNLESMTVDAKAGNDQITLDDNWTKTEVLGGAGADQIQVGQIFKSKRDADANVAAYDVFSTIATTRGYLSNGISYETTIRGGDDNDQFTVFRNVAKLDLFGDNGDDLFTIRSFATENSNTVYDVNTGTGNDFVEYVANAQVKVDGGAGNDTLKVVFTEFADKFLITADAIIGGGRVVTYTNIENLEIDGAEGDDEFYVFSTDANVITKLSGGLGNDTFSIGGDIPAGIDPGLPTALPSGFAIGVDGKLVVKAGPHNLAGIRGALSIDGFSGSGTAGGLGNPVMLPGETNRLPSTGAIVSYQGTGTANAIDTMVVNTADLQAFVDQSPSLSTLADLKLLTLEISQGNGLGRFWQIVDVTVNGTQTTLKLKNPGIPAAEWTQASSNGEFAITNLSPNFFIDERIAQDRIIAFNDGTTVANSGALSANQLTGLGMAATGIGYANLEIAEVLLGSDNDTFTVNGTANGSITAIHGGGGSDTITVNDRGNTDSRGFNDSGNPITREASLIIYGDTSQDGGRYTGASGTIAAGVAYAFSNPVNGNDTINASASQKSVTIYGGAGNDSIKGSQAGDQIAGGSGDDTVSGNAGVDHIYGDSGFNVNVLTGTLTVATTNGSAAPTADGLLAGKDNLQGDEGDDIILGDHGIISQTSGTSRLLTTGNVTQIETTEEPNGANDTISGGNGRDRILGGNGADSITGGDGDDVILGDNGVIVYNADSNLTTLDQVKTRNTIDGGSDTISGNAGNDLILGGTAGDVIAGGNGTTGAAISGSDKDAILGDFGQIDLTNGIISTITSTDATEGGADTIQGNEDDDVIVGGAAGDTINAGHGRNIVLGDQGYVDYVADDNDTSDIDRISTVVDEANLTDAGLGGDDTITTGQDSDIILGGTGSDTINAGQGDNNIVISDNGQILSANTLGVADLATPLDGHPITLGRIQTIAPTIGGNDTITTGTGRDIVLGGAGSDTVFAYGSADGITPNAAAAQDGKNLVIGDNGFVDYVVDDNNPADIDRIWSTDTAIGGNDTIWTGASNDIVIGGAGNDTVSGGNGSNILMGDSAELTSAAYDAPNPTYSAHPFTLGSIISTGFENGGNDSVTGSDGNDVIIGGGGDDVINAGKGNDLVFGDQGKIDAGNDPTKPFDPSRLPVGCSDPIQFTALKFQVGGFGNDTIYGGDGDDILMGQEGADVIYGGAGDDDIIGGSNVAGALDTGDRLDGGTGNDIIAGDNAFICRDGNTSPRMRTLEDTTLYGETPTVNDGEPLVNATWQPIPTGAKPRKVTLLDHASDTASTLYGNDYIAGNAGDDHLYGQLGNDTIQGDGDIDIPAVSARRLANGDLAVAASVERATDGDDYIEGNGGDDAIFGNLGQDDIIGGSSNLYGLTAANLRPDGKDLIFGGAGTDITRNDPGDITANGHARDSDMILGDNGNIFRIVGVNKTYAGQYLTFSYDNYGTQKIVPRVSQLLDYTPGGLDYNTAAAQDIGASDEIHGESGDDFIYGMVGNDVLFGEGQDDDIIGGYGNDWISGGTGEDGVIGDDGRIYTSRNGTAESLYGIAATTQQEISTPGKIQQAIINIVGKLKKAVNLTPFSTDPNWNGTSDEFSEGVDATHRSDDIIFGGLGNDFLHGGSGDDAISGAEALPEAYIRVYDEQGNLAGVIRSDYNRPFNPGDVLAYSPLDLDGRQQRDRAGEFALYDEYDPLRKILLTDSGDLSKTGSGKEFLLNFTHEGPLSAAFSGFAAVPTDGDDVIFGGLGNDWLVGGTGRDNLYGGWGNDLLNADDNQTTNGGLNDQPDTHPTYEDRAFGGAGRDVLIANTGGDRLIDWVGEFNSYLVPFAPFGMATVSRTLQPQLSEFLYALSQSDGADATRAADTGAEDFRNGEPFGELGLIRQKDFAWKDQTGAPADPQAGNIPGGKRDVLRTSNFNDGTAQGFAADSGTWTLTQGRLQVAPETLGSDAVSVFYVDSYIPNYFEMQATIRAVRPTAGYKANSYLIFDYQSKNDFKFAGIDLSTNKLVMGRRTAAGWIVDVQSNMQLKADTDYNLFLSLNGSTATLVIDNQRTLTHTFPISVDASGITYGLNRGMVGIGADNARATIDNVTVQRLTPQITSSKTVDFSQGSTSLFQSALTGQWQTTSDGYYKATPTIEPAIALVNQQVSPASVLQLSTTLQLSADGQGGFIFDQYSETDYKFVTISAETGQIIIGHSTAKEGIEIDATFNTLITANTNYQLGITLQGNTISVTLNNQLVLSYSFNALITDGWFGLLGMEGLTAFDLFTVSTNDQNLVF